MNRHRYIATQPKYGNLLAVSSGISSWWSEPAPGGSVEILHTSVILFRKSPCHCYPYVARCSNQNMVYFLYQGSPAFFHGRFLLGLDVHQVVISHFFRRLDGRWRHIKGLNFQQRFLDGSYVVREGSVDARGSLVLLEWVDVLELELLEIATRLRTLILRFLHFLFLLWHVPLSFGCQPHEVEEVPFWNAFLVRSYLSSYICQPR
jgi:hypothetical protein